MGLSWMAWTWETGIFFVCIAGMLIGMTIWELRSPGGAPRRGILAIDTTRGDRLFISLLGSAFIHLGWLSLFGPPFGERLRSHSSLRLVCSGGFRKDGFYWHKADSDRSLAMSAVGGKADVVQWLLQRLILT